MACTSTTPDLLRSARRVDVAHIAAASHFHTRIGSLLIGARSHLYGAAGACLQVLREENNDLIIPYLQYARLRSHPPS